MEQHPTSGALSVAVDSMLSNMELVVILVSIGITSVVCFGLGWLYRGKGCFVFVPIALGFTVFSVFLSGAIGEFARYLGLMHQGGDVWGLMQWFYLGLIVFPVAYAFGSKAGDTNVA